MAPPRIIPAYAGNTLSGPTRRRSCRNHPRLRGEHPACLPHFLLRSGSSPLTRGTRVLDIFPGLVLRIIPAYAGNTLLIFPVLVQPKDHPRLRGEHKASITGCSCALGSSPLTRGTRLNALKGVHRFRIIPAYAGNTPFMAFRTLSSSDHPRLRGEHLASSIILL